MKVEAGLLDENIVPGRSSSCLKGSAVLVGDSVAAARLLTALDARVQGTEGLLTNILICIFRLTLFQEDRLKVWSCSGVCVGTQVRVQLELPTQVTTGFDHGAHERDIRIINTRLIAGRAFSRSS